MTDLIELFLNKKNVFAVIGVSNNLLKYGRKVYDDLKIQKYKVYPINPTENFIANDKCYSDLRNLPQTPDVVVFVVPPSITEKVLLECNKLGINKIWLQPGSESEKAINFCKQKNISCLHNQCVMLNL